MNFKEVYEYKSHHSYLKDRFELGSKKWGSKSKFADYLRIQAAYLSQVLSEKYSLSLEQADLANHYFEHTKDESEFFILLVSKDRAGSKSLKDFYTNQINAKLAQRQKLVATLGRKTEIDEKTKGVYYSSWLYSAVHVCCTIPSLRTRRSIAAHLNVGEEIIEKILEFLLESTMIEKKLDEYHATQNWVRLGKDSPHIVKHHTNWRLQAVQNLEEQTDDDVHFSGVYSIDHATAREIKNQIMTFIKSQQKNIEQSKEEALYVLGVDFFEK